MDALSAELGIPKKNIKPTQKSDQYTALVHKQWLQSLIKHSKLASFTETEDLQPLLITVYNKRDANVIPLPRIRTPTPPNDPPLFFCQLLQYIAHTNHKYLWKEAYKKYSQKADTPKDTAITLLPYNTVLRETIQRTYGCPFIDPAAHTTENSLQSAANLNVLPALACVDAPRAFLLLHLPHFEHNLHDCVTFSPAILTKSSAKPLFIVYQLLQTLKAMHDRSITLGDVALADIRLDEDMWIALVPAIASNIHLQEPIPIEPQPTRSLFRNYDRIEVGDAHTLPELCQLWTQGLISNFSYISALNRLAGRKLNDPNRHHVFPWVTDFSAPHKAWRDLKKSKYRLNKGDRQLDLTFESDQVPHHVSDVLSSITYYVYMARRTPKPVLCRNVRTNWVPAEYPSSVQRMQEWTPDECIPEFFTDPSVFRSIHEDLDDLEVPAWCATPEDFIERHREALESAHVSERLHHWIDLTFGYKLAGVAAVKAKNVCLNLVDDHGGLTKSGIVQLFTVAHPQKGGNGVFWGKVAPKVQRKERERSCSPFEVRSDEDDAFSRSRLPSNDETIGKSTRSASLGPKNSTFQSHIKTSGIFLPKEYKPELALELLEKKRTFFVKTFHRNETSTNDSNTNILRHPLTPFSHHPNPPTQNQTVCNYSEIISSRRIRELQVLGCLIIEIFMAKQLRALDPRQSFPNRLAACLTILKNAEIPLCIRKIVDLLLQPDSHSPEFKYPAVSAEGLPPPNAHLLLEPLLHSILPFHKLFPKLYQLIASLKEFKQVRIELQLASYFDCDGAKCAEFEAMERRVSELEAQIGECQVKKCVRQLDDLLVDLNPSTDAEIVDILVLHIRDLIETPSMAILAVWYLFDPMARVLGTKLTGKYLLKPILKLYENEPFSAKIAKLYHRSFLLRLIVRLGLKVFLDNFIVPLVEAVGRYKDCHKLEFRCHSHNNKEKKTSHLKEMCGDPIVSISEPEMFVFEDETPKCDETEPDWGLDATLPENLDQLRSLEELTLNLSEEETILSTSKTSDLMNISCGVGSFDARSLFEEQQAKPTVQRNDDDCVKTSDVSAESIIWLSHRLGPVLTARHLSRNLLKMLTLCYGGKDNMAEVVADVEKGNEGVSVSGLYVVGDQSAGKVLECLAAIAGLYGEQLILFQYIPHMSELIVLCKRKLTPNLEGGLISCLALLQHVIPYLSDLTLMDHLQDVILKNILNPIVRLLGSTKYTFPSGALARNVLANKYIDCMYVLSIRMGSDMTRTHLAVPALQRFFLIFDRIHSSPNDSTYSEENQVIEPSEEIIEVNRDGTFNEWTISGRPLQISSASSTKTSSPQPSEDIFNQAIEELRSVFTPHLAHTAYVPFLRHIGANSLEISLKNHALVRDLCQDFESETKTLPRHQIADFPIVARNESITASSSIGSNIALIGNRIDVQSDHNLDLLSLVSNRMENNNRHLRGNWLAYWEHEIGRSDKDATFNFKQIKLQAFHGHTHSVKCLQVLDNENSFMSGSRDKTVKLWSLRSHGDGQSISPCQWTYTAHKKSVLSLTFVESMRLVASCDSVVHIWDPFMGANVGHLESVKYAPVNCLKSLPAPSCLFLAATTDGTVKLVDARICSYIHELKVSLNPSGLIRTLAVAPNGTWLATGQSSGTITVLETRTGMVVSSWRAHEGEVLQLVAFDNATLISTSFDQTIGVWGVSDGRFLFNLRGATEPVHCLNVFNEELISGTTANRIGVHTSIDQEASFSSTKLRSDAFKGLLTSMALLPLNRLLLLGADTGAVNLLC